MHSLCTVPALMLSAVTILCQLVCQFTHRISLPTSLLQKICLTRPLASWDTICWKYAQKVTLQAAVHQTSLVL